MTIDEIPSKVNKTAITDEIHQLSAGEVNAIVSQVKENRDALSVIPVEAGTGPNSLVQTGTGCIASGTDSSALGSINTARGKGAHAEGMGTFATGGCSHAEGLFTEAKNEAEHACGRYNSSTASSDTAQQTVFSVGIGDGLKSDGTCDRRNALEAKRNGDLYMWLNGKYVKLQDIITAYDYYNYYTEQSGKAVLRAPEVAIGATGSGKVLSLTGYKVLIQSGLDNIVLNPGTGYKVLIGTNEVATVDMLESIKKRLTLLEGNAGLE